MKRVKRPSTRASPAPAVPGAKWRRGITGLLLVLVIAPALMFGAPYLIAFYYNWRGDTLQSRGEYVAAASSYRRAIRIRPAPRTLEKLGAAYIGEKHPAAAISAFQRAITLAPRDSSTRYHVALGLLKLGQVQNAQQQLNEAVAIDRRNGMAHLALSNLARARGDQATAVRELEIAVDDGVNTGDAHLRLAEVCLSRGDLRAEQQLQDAVSVDPALAPAQLRLGCLLLNSDTHDAETHLQQALDLGIASPDDRARALLGLALAAYRESDLHRAQTYLQQAEAAQPGPDLGATLDYALGVVRRDNGNAASSLEAFSAAIKQRSCVPAFRMGASIGRLTLDGEAMLAERDGRFGLAAHDFALLVAGDPHDAQLRIHLGSALMAQNDLPHAIAAFSAATRLAPANPQGWLKLSAALLQSGKLPDSSAALTKALHLEPHWTLYRPDVDMLLGKVDLALNRPDAAQLCFRFAAQSQSPVVDPDNCLTLLEIAAQRSQQLAEAAQTASLAADDSAIVRTAAPMDTNAISLTAEKQSSDRSPAGRIERAKGSDRPSLSRPFVKDHERGDKRAPLSGVGAPLAGSPADGQPKTAAPAIPATATAAPVSENPASVVVKAVPDAGASKKDDPASKDNPKKPDDTNAPGPAPGTPPAKAPGSGG
ncbi:MAG TPA: tetratricopeptide repeat protein [Armatimonadota bacterium]|nr:tetratricopeptide repeat protein [Armatimonadota bacterium]